MTRCCNMLQLEICRALRLIFISATAQFIFVQTYIWHHYVSHPGMLYYKQNLCNPFEGRSRWISPTCAWSSNELNLIHWQTTMVLAPETVARRHVQFYQIHLVMYLRQIMIHTQISKTNDRWQTYHGRLSVLFVELRLWATRKAAGNVIATSSHKRILGM